MNEQIRSTSPLTNTILWSLLVLGAVGNMVASAAGAGIVAHLVLGGVTALAAAGLVTLWLRARA